MTGNEPLPGLPDVGNRPPILEEAVWTWADVDAAARQGWGLFRRDDTDEYELQKLDDPDDYWEGYRRRDPGAEESYPGPRFADDAEAGRRVAFLARGGDETAQKASRLLVERRSADASDFDLPGT